MEPGTPAAPCSVEVTGEVEASIPSPPVEELPRQEVGVRGVPELVPPASVADATRTVDVLVRSRTLVEELRKLE